MPDKLPILILAAGSSKRLGQPKQLLDLNNKRLISHIVDEAVSSKIGDVYVVTGYQKEQIEAELENTEISLIYNDNWQEGMGGSIREGVNNLDFLDYRGVIISVCDQPYITAEIFKNLSDKINTSKKGIVYCEYENGFGPPAYFNRKYLNELNSLSGDRGAKSLILNYKRDTDKIPFPYGSFDLDTSEDYKLFLNRKS